MLNSSSASIAAKRLMIASDMIAACRNAHIGYDQYERDTLYKAAEKVGFDCARVDEDVETDCSALVRVCCAYAGIMLPNFNTETEPGVLLKSGAFEELTGAKYTDSSDWLQIGDILDTRTKGHTVVVLTNGPRAGEDEDGQRTLRRGDKGEDVKELQLKLLAHGYSVGPDGADGDFGRNTETAVKAGTGQTPRCSCRTWTKRSTIRARMSGIICRRCSRRMTSYAM